MTNIQKATAEIFKTIMKFGLTYNQTKVVFKAAREQANLKPVIIKKGAVDTLTYEQQFKFIKTAYNISGRRGLMMQVLLETGCRVTAFTKIMIDDISFENRLITIHEGKGNKRRRIPITIDLANKLKIHIGERKSGPVFRSRQRPYVYTKQRIGQMVKEVAKAAGITKRVYPHLLRHTIALKLLNEGMPIADLAQFLGHDDISTTQIYARSSTATLQKKFDSITNDTPFKKLVEEIRKNYGEEKAGFAMALLEK